MGRYVLCKQLHIVEGSASLGKAGGSLDVICAGVGNALAKSDLFLVGQKAGLDDDLQKLAVAGLLNGGDLLGNVAPFAVLCPADVNDHIHLISAVLYGIGGHKALGGSGGIAVGEADDGADGKLVPYIVLGLPDISGRNADGGGAILDAVVANCLNLCPGSSLTQQSVVAFFENIGKFHHINSFQFFVIITEI